MFFLIAAFTGCKEPPPFVGRFDLQGKWKGTRIEITASPDKQASFDVEKYGSASISISKDSIYSFYLEISKDVVLEREVLGNTYAKTLIQGGYSNYRTGFYYAADSRLIFLNADRDVIDTGSYHFEGRKLLTNFKDKESRIWKISWQKEE